MGGSGGEGGDSDPGAAARKLRCDAICQREVYANPLDTSSDMQQCNGDYTLCSDHLCNVGEEPSCIEALDALLECVESATNDYLYCTDSPSGGFDGVIAVDFAGLSLCDATYNAYVACIDTDNQ
jgi:hypothetical protein